MEEQKKSKTVSINSNNKAEEAAPQKLSYEALNDACNQLLQQNRQLVVKNRQLEQFIMNKRLEFLFKVVENSSKFSSDFVGDCTAEIEDAMTVPQEKEEETKDKD